MKISGTRTLAVIILAAGKGSRMKSHKAKVLHLLAGVPLIQYSLQTVQGISPEKVVVVIGFQAEAVKASLKSIPVEFVFQKEQLGTGHAVLQTYPLLKDFMGEIMVLSGDVPLLTPESLIKLFEAHCAQKAVVSFLTAELDNPKGYGRVIRGKGLEVIKVVEDKDATSQERKIKEINSGIYCFEKDFLFEALGLINQDNRQGEYYLTDLVHIAHQRKLKVTGQKTDQPLEVLGVNTIEELSRIEYFLQEVNR
jgi:UDP-N-acetylglucosamine diphosphorylase/glucosamine-1-phosphate N-acetyltransferase